ncbi:hypothetical protein ACNOYE_19625 [Nannocystaceae bacterium ST9]
MPSHRSLLGSAFVVALLVSAGPVEADTLEVDPDLGYVPIEELSYETIVRPGSGYEAELAVRVAFNNASASPQDMVEAIGLPQGAELTGFSVDFDGTWIDAEPSSVAKRTGPRDPGSVFVHMLPPESAGDLPGAEIVAVGLPARATTQIELRMRVFPILRGDRWQLELPRRHLGDLPNLIDRRRVLVQGLPQGESFWVDDTSNGSSPYMVTRAEDAVVVAWPAHLHGGGQLDGNLEVSRASEGEGGRLRMVLRLGSSKPISPDHVLLLVDRSQSGASTLPREAGDMLAALLDHLPRGTTFDAIAFAREAEPLLAEGEFPTRDDGEALDDLEARLGKLKPTQGTDLRGAMQVAGERLAARGAKAPLIVIATDGMLPRSVGAELIEQALADALGKAKRPELLFVVDDPLLNLRGLPADHPIADLAAGLGARISLETLANLGPADTAELLAAPRVLGDLELGLPDSVVLDDELPVGLVAGDFVVIEGSWFGNKPPSKVRVRGRLGTSKVSTTLAASKRPEPPGAFATAWREGDRAQAIEEGMSMPEWYTLGMRRVTTLNLAQAGRVGWQATGQLDASIIRRELRIRVLPRARACYNLALTRNRQQSGRVEFAMEVGKGEVMIAGLGKTELSHDDPAFVECLEQAAWALDVPAGNLDTQVYAIRYPLDLSAPEGGESQTDEGDAALVERLVRSAEVLADFQKAEKAKTESE